jgi:hypothetical protein
METVTNLDAAAPTRLIFTLIQEQANEKPARHRIGQIHLEAPESR